MKIEIRARHRAAMRYKESQERLDAFVASMGLRRVRVAEASIEWFRGRDQTDAKGVLLTNQKQVA